MPGRLNLKFADYGSEYSNFSVNIPTLAAGNIASVAGAGGDVEDLVTAIGGISEGLIVKTDILASTAGSGSGKATNPYAQRELKWLVSYHDTTTLKTYQVEIPCPTLSATLLADGTPNSADLSATAWQTFITAFEQVVRSPTSGAVVVDSAKLVGRNI